MMYFTPKPCLIYDNKTKSAAVLNNDEILLYSKTQVASFTKEYWLNWYGITKSKNFIEHNGIDDKIFEFSSKNKTISLNYHYCSDADVQIITSNRLVCKTNKLIVPYNKLDESGVVLVFCEKDECYVKLGHKPIWKIIPIPRLN